MLSGKVMPWCSHMRHRVVVTGPLPDLLKMSLLLLPPERQVDLWDDWWTNRHNEPLSVVWSKIRSSIKIALWNLSALCQWSACSAVDISLPSSARSHFLSAFVCLSSFLLPVFLLPFFSSSKLRLYLHSLDSLFFCFELSFRASSCSLLRPVTKWLAPAMRDAYRGVLCHLMLFIQGGGGEWGVHTCISRQGCLWLSCPQALRMERDRVWGSRRGEWQTVGGRKWRNGGSKMRENGRKAER